MSQTTTNVMTAKEFFAWCHRPENRDKRCELERGRVLEMPPPGQRHGCIQMNGGFILNRYIRQQRKGCLSGDAGVLLEHDPDTIRGPDIAYYDLTPTYSQLNPKYSEEPPKLAIEIMSPTDRMSTMEKRATQFLRWGVAMVWVIDPEDRTVMVFRPGEFTQVLTDEEELTGNGLLPAFRCRVAEFFYTSGEDAEPPAS